MVEVQEGLARILVPRRHAIKGPGSVGRVPFYNKVMAFPRHISVLLLDALQPRPRRVLDGLASTGVLGVRLALEVADGFRVVINDRRQDAYELIRRNVELNGLTNATPVREDLNVLLCRERFDYVDLDPFGSSVPFLDNALRALRPRGYLAMTATDTAALAGTYPKTCVRRYGAMPVRAPFSHEVGLRILAGFVVRSAAKYDLAARPLLLAWREHYYKAFFEVVSGARRADRVLGELGYVRYTPGGQRTVGLQGEIGPLWSGPLHDADLLGRVRSRDYMPIEVSRLLEVWLQEANAPALFYTTDEVASCLRMPAPKIRRALEALQGAGFAAYRTSFHPKGFKTEASWEEVLRILGGP